MRKWPVAGGLAHALYVAERESHFAWYARNPSSGACGIYQHIPTYWPGRQRIADGNPIPIPESCFDARANIITTIRMVHHGSWAPWGG